MTHSQGGGLDVIHAFEVYASEVLAFANRSYKTEEHYFAALKSITNYMGDVYLPDLTLEQVRGWKEHLERRKLSQNTIRGYLNKLRIVLAYFRKQGYDLLDPELIPLPKRVQPPVAFLTRQEVYLLIRTAKRPCRGYPAVNRARNQAMISLLYGSGIRVGELCSLNRSDIRSDLKSFSVMGKGNKSRLCFLDDRSMMLIREYLRLRDDNHPALFLANQTHSRIRPGEVQRIVAALGRKSGINKRIHPHILRHSFATDLLINNCNPRYVQRMLGHSSLDTTMIYMNIVDRDLQDIYSKFHKV